MSAQKYHHQDNECFNFLVPGAKCNGNCRDVVKSMIQRYANARKWKNMREFGGWDGEEAKKKTSAICAILSATENWVSSAMAFFEALKNNTSCDFFGNFDVFEFICWE